MASNEEWCSEVSSKLQREDLRISTLNEIKEHFSSISQLEVSKLVNILSLPLVFDCLNDTNSEQVDLACEVLSLCMNNLSLGESTNKYDIPLERSLNHPYTSVKLMALGEIYRNISKEESLVDICKRMSLFMSILKCLGDNDIAVAKRAFDIMCVIGLSDLGLKTLISSDGMKVAHQVMNVNEVARLRYYEMVINLSKESESNFNLLNSTGVFTDIIEELKSNDVLLRMNVVELLTQLGLSHHGFIFLDKSGVLGELFAMIEDEEQPLTVQLCEPGILKFFGNMARNKPIELLSKYPKFFDRLFSNLESGNLTIVGISLDTLGTIGLSGAGKCALQSTGNRITYAIKTVIKLLPSLPTEVRMRALNCLENLLSVTETVTDLTQITRKWYLMFGDEPMELILRYAKNPFSEIKLAGLGLLHALANQTWGQEEINNTPGLVEYLLDRNTETVKECKEMKYGIIKLLANSSIFDSPTTNRLREYVKEGPFYVHVITEIAFEGND
nr:26S proteasome non-ATPase regulatory subunit 5-like [Leptinotarsa decemlineata]